jgi:hypothetical protein
MIEDNVIPFPKKIIEDVTIDNDIHQQALLFTTELIKHVHQYMHENTKDCIFSDEDYHPLIALSVEIFNSMYLMANGVDHPMQDFAKEFYVVDKS